MQSSKSWYQLYRVAILETDNEKLHSRLQAARRSISARQRELQLDGNGKASEQEWEALEDALAKLEVLSADRLGGRT